ncbi:MAG: pilin [Candidatus Paceibacterota bacterium]|jgi:hypothetical protein
MKSLIKISSSLALGAILAIILVSSAHAVFAADYTYVPLTSVPGITDKAVVNPTSVFKGIYAFAIGIGSILAVVMIVAGGFKYMYEESITGHSDAKEKITNAFLGLLLILGSYLILRTINKDFVQIDFVLPGGTGKLSTLVAVQRATDATYAALDKSSAELASKLQSAEKLENQAWDLGDRNNYLEKRIRELKAAGKTDSDPEIAKLSAELEQNGATALGLFESAKKIREDAQQKAREDFISKQAQLSVADILNYNIDSFKERAGKINDVTSKSIDAINNDASLSAEAKAKKISDLKLVASAEKYLIGRQGEVNSILKADSGILTGTLSQGTLDKLSSVKSDLDRHLAAVDANYKDPAVKEKVKAAISSTITSIDTMQKVTEEKNAEARSKKIKILISAGTGPIGALSCMVFCQ